jgi:hypothetical protein
MLFVHGLGQWRVQKAPIVRRHFGFESGGQSERTSMGLPLLWTVGDAEFVPPASGKIALFSIAIELDVFSLPRPEVAADDVVQRQFSIEKI